MSSDILGPQWNLCPEGINIVTQNGAIKDSKTILKNALDSDLKLIGKPAIANELSKSRIGKIVLQIQKIRNISAPKAKEESQAAPRMLKLTLTDGDSYIQAIEMSSINSISREKTAPGTKVLVNDATLVSGYLLINPQNFTVLGGQVEHLYEKWLLAKSIQLSQQLGKVSTEGAPPWVPFGGKILTGNEDKSFKSLEKSKDANIDSEFDQQRKDAIAEASSGAIRKTFGGRVKQNVQPVQANQQFHSRGKTNDKDHDRSKKGKFSQKDDEVVEKLQRPSEKVSLFAFLEDKLPMPEPKKPVETKIQSTTSYSRPANYNYQKDTRIQQKPEGNQNRGDYRTSSKQPQIQRNDRPSKVQSYNANVTSAESVSSTAKYLPQKSNNFSNNGTNPKYDASETNNSIKKNSDVANNVNNYNSKSYQQNPKNNQPNRYRNNYDKQNEISNDRNNFVQPHNQFGNYNNYPKPHQKGEITESNVPLGGPQFSNSNNYPQPNTTHQKPQHYHQNPSQNAEVQQLTNNFSKMSVNNEFASRSLRQHLNLGPPKRQFLQGSQGTVPNSLNIGDQCMAKYWEDGKFYPATVAAITEKTYAVQFTGYGNIEEVLKHDCFSPVNSYSQYNRPQNYSYPQNFSGTSMEFRSRRGPPRN